MNGLTVEPAALHAFTADALGATPGAITTVRRLPSGENAVYHVIGPDGPAVLRFTAESHRTLAELHAELAWLRHLEANGVDAVRPLGPAPSGPYPLAGGASWHCVVFEYVDGAPPRPSDVTAPLMRQWGELIGAIHAAGPAPPPGTGRAHWRRTANYDVSLLRLGAAERAAVTDVLDCASREAGDTNRLVHADLGLENVLWTGGKLVALDFDDACRAPAVYDVAAILYDVLVDHGATAWADPAELLSALIAGYRRRAPLPARDLARLGPLWAALVVERAITPHRLGRRDQDATHRLRTLLASGRLPEPLAALDATLPRTPERNS